MACGRFVPSAPKILSHLALQTEHLVSGNVFISKAPAQHPRDSDFLPAGEGQKLGPCCQGPVIDLPGELSEGPEPPQQPDFHVAFPPGGLPGYKSLGDTHSS